MPTERRDILKEQIDELGKVLARILSKVLGLNAPLMEADEIETIHQQLRTDLDLDIDELISIPTPELQGFLESKLITAEHFETMADYLARLGENTLRSQPNKGIELLQRAVQILEIADIASKSTSFDRLNKREKMLHLLKQKGQ